MSTQPGVNVNRTVKKLNPHSEENLAQLHLDTAGKELRSPGFELLGSWAVHVYQSNITREIEIKVQQHMPQELDKDGNKVGVTEQLALVSLEEARRALMGTFGKLK